MSETEPPRTQPGPERRSSLTGIALGGLLIVAGGAWLLETLDVLDVSLDVILPAALVVVGVILIAAARRGRHGGLIALGVVLTILSAAMSAADVTGGVGRRHIRVTGTEQVREYDLGIGELVLDLTELEPNGTVDLKAEVGIGELRVELPADVPVRVHAESGIGQVDVLGQEDGGFGSELDHTDGDFGSAPAALDLEVSAGIGEVTVTR
ncbi:MAG: LiaF domain-containing protein [Actinomycetota bacterium]